MKEFDGASNLLSEGESNVVLGFGSRLAVGPTQELVQTAFARELSDQVALFRGMSLADLAHTIMLIEAGVIPTADGAALLSALLALHEFPRDFTPIPESGDLYTNREAWLAARTPAVGWLGAGRARRESTATGYRITVRSYLLAFADALLKAGRALIARADEYRSTLMADYTYLQPTQPTTFGHDLLGFAYPLLRDVERLQALYSRTNRSPAGCGSVNGSHLSQDRSRLAELLCFDGLAQHARDAMWQPDGPIETLSVAIAALINLDRLAEDLQIFATAEFDLVELDEGHTHASVIMPQKKNPYALNYAPVAESRLANGFAMATDLAETITLETGLDFHSAHRIVGRLVRDAAQTKRLMRDLTVADLDAAALVILNRPLRLPEAVFAQALDPASAVAARQGIGGAAAEPLAECSAGLDACTTWQKKAFTSAESAEEALLRYTRSFVGVYHARPSH